MLDTKLSVKEIEDLIILKLHQGGVRANLCVPNVSWGAGINYEADLVVVTKAGYATEYEIKRSWTDFLADFKKDERAHKAPWVYRFAYVVPDSIIDKVLAFLSDIGNEIPAVIGYTENRQIKKYGGFYEVEGGRKMFLEEQLKIARLGTLRYWSLRNKKEENHEQRNNF